MGWAIMVKQKTINLIATLYFLFWSLTPQRSFILKLSPRMFLKVNKSTVIVLIAS